MIQYMKVSPLGQELLDWNQKIEAIAKESNLTLEEASRALLREKVPSETFVTVEQLGGLCTFLCSNYAEQLTGQDIAVDGGWTSV